MRPAPTPNKDETHSDPKEIIDPLSEECDRLWNDTARKNREILTELFRPTPTNLVRSWSAYEVRLYPSINYLLINERCLFCPQNYVPKVKTGHVVPGVKLERLKQRLSQVRGALVEAPLVCLYFSLPLSLRNAT